MHSVPGDSQARLSDNNLFSAPNRNLITMFTSNHSTSINSFIFCSLSVPLSFSFSIYFHKFFSSFKRTTCSRHSARSQFQRFSNLLWIFESKYRDRRFYRIILCFDRHALPLSSLYWWRKNYTSFYLGRQWNCFRHLLSNFTVVLPYDLVCHISVNRPHSYMCSLSSVVFRICKSHSKLK